MNDNPSPQLLAPCLLAGLLSLVTCLTAVQVALTGLGIGLQEGELLDNGPYVLALLCGASIVTGAWLLTAAARTWTTGSVRLLALVIKVELGLCAVWSLSWLVGVRLEALVSQLAVPAGLAACFVWLLQMTMAAEPEKDRMLRRERSSGSIWG